MSFDLNGMMRDMMKKEGLGKENTITITNNLGLDILDYRNGKIEDGYVLTGVNDARILTAAGKSGTGRL